MKLEVKNVSCGYDTRAVISGISLTVGCGESLCILGPNGIASGKNMTVDEFVFRFLQIAVNWDGVARPIWG